MSFMFISPGALEAAAQELARIHSTISAADTAAASITQLAPAAADEVSAAIAELFGTYGQVYQSLIGQAGSFHSQFVQSLASGGNLYAAAESAANSDLLQALVELA